MEVNENDFAELERLLKYKCVPKKTNRKSRLNFGDHRSVTYGITKGRFNGIVGLSYSSLRNSEIFEEIMKIGEKYCPFEFTSVHLNHNVTCPRHKDTNNIGDSMIISFGEYTGCNLVIEGKICDARYKPIIFNGSEKEHWNTDDLQGNKYSLVYFVGDFK